MDSDDDSDLESSDFNYPFSSDDAFDNTWTLDMFLMNLCCEKLLTFIDVFPLFRKSSKYKHKNWSYWYTQYRHERVLQSLYKLTEPLTETHKYDSLWWYERTDT